MNKDSLLEKANKLSSDWDHVEDAEKREVFDSLILFLRELEDHASPINTVAEKPDTEITDSSLTPIPRTVTKHTRPIYTPSPS